MSLFSQWLLTAACLLGGLMLSRGLRRMDVPMFPWRLPWIALTSQSIETTLIAFDVPGASTLNFDVLNQILLALAASRVITWATLDLLPKLHLLPQSSKIFKDCIFILGGATLVFLTLQQQSNIDLVGLITTSAVLTAVLGLAAQEPLKDLIGGVSLQLEQVIREGDWVEIDNHVGQVTSISWRGTELRNKNGSRIILPHATVSSKNIANHSSFGSHRDTIHIELSNRIPPHLVKTIMGKIANHHPLVLNKPTPIARIDRFETNSIFYEWHVWHHRYNDRYRARGELQEQLWYALNRECPFSAFPVQHVELEPRRRTTRHTNTTKRLYEEESLRLLKNNSLFEHLTNEQFLQIIQHSPVHAYGTGETIVTENECGDSLFLVVNGHVQILKKTEDGQPIKITELSPGDIFGEMTLFTGEPRSASAKCLSNADVLEVNRETLATLMAQEPSLLQKMGQLIDERKTTLQHLQEEQLHEQSSQDTVMQMQRLFASLLN